MNSKTKKETQPKVSYHYKPENMSLVQWQIALRQQIAAKELFGIQPIHEKQHPGYYNVKSPASRNEYKVVFRGTNSPWNYCSCMDFKTSKLGTCKHIEAVKLWIEQNNKKTYKGIPPYTSVYLSYKGERKVCLRIGSDNPEEFRQLAEPYFTSDGIMRPEAINTVTDFFRAAIKLNNTFRWYPDVLEFILEQRDNHHRNNLLSKWTDNKLNSLLKTSLYTYQKEGIRFAFRAGKAIIADEMGLGKTIQAIGTAELMKKENLISSVLILCPTSLKYQWKKEIERFTSSTAIVVEGNHLARKKLYAAEEFYKIASYNSACNDIKVLKSLRTDFLIMDEVQRLKNWKTQISQAARRIESEYTVILSGTPLENKLEELYSITQFVDQYCLGPYYQFMDQAVITSDTGKVIGYQNLNAIGQLMKNILIRRRKQDVALQLPERTDKILFVPMTDQQREMHDELKHQVGQLVTKWTRQRFLNEKDRKRLLLFMGQMRMLCDSTYILHQKSRYDTKIEETMNILQNIFESGDEKVVVFSQWERMTRLIGQELDKLNIRYEYLHGGIPSVQRKELTENFTNLPESRVFLSTDAGSTGLNLQVASTLINLDLPWNPAVLEQRIARIHRIGQKNTIQVINLVSSQTFEEDMLDKLNFKTSLFAGILDNGEDAIFLEDSKFDKMMGTIKEMVDTENETTKTDDSCTIQVGEKEETSTKEEKETREEELSAEENDLSTIEGETMTTEEPFQQQENPQLLFQQGLSFFNGLARTLKSPEATQKLVDSLVEEDKETGQASLRIPVPNKESVKDILTLVGKLFGQNT